MAGGRAAGGTGLGVDNLMAGMFAEGRKGRKLKS